MANTTNRTTRIKHVFGNVLKLAIPLTLRTVTLEGGIVEVTDTDYTPSNHYPVVVQFVNGPLKYELDATIRDNYIAVVEDKGTIPVGNYAIVVLCKDDNGDPRRFKQRCVLEVVDVTADAGIEVGIEFEAQEWLLDGAIFLAIKGEDGIDGVGIESITTDETSVSGEYNQVTFHLTNGSSYTLNVRNGESTEQTLPANVVVDENYVHTDNNYTDTDKQKIESVDKLFADAEYDRISRRLNFFKHGDTMHTNPLKSIDITDFVRDSRVSSFRIIDDNLTIRLNSDGNNEEFKVPITSINANYYTKSQTDAKLSQKVNLDATTGRVDASQATRVVLDYIVGIYDGEDEPSHDVNAGDVWYDNGQIHYAYNNDVIVVIVSLGAPQKDIIYCNAENNKLYRWNGSEFVQVGGSGSGSGGYEPPVGGIPKTDLAPAVQASLGKADTALQSSDLDGYATTDDVDDAVAALVSSAPQTLDTLKELADALGDDPNFATTIATQLGNKVDKETGKVLIPSTDLTKLQNLPTADQLTQQIGQKANDNAVVKTVTINGETKQPQNGNVSFNVQAGGESVVINSDGANIVDSHTNPSILVAPSARQMYMAAQNIDTLFRKVNDLYDKLAGIAFTDGKPANWKEYVDWSSVAIPTHTITLGTMTNVTASLNDTPISDSTSATEGEVTLKLTPAQDTMILTENISIKLGTKDVPFTTSADNGSTLVTFVLAGDVTITASASSGIGVQVNGNNVSANVNGIAFSGDNRTIILSHPNHFEWDGGIGLSVNSVALVENTDYTLASNQDGTKTITVLKTFTSDAYPIVITASVVEDAHAILDLTNVGSGVTVNKEDSEHVYEGDTISILPASGNKVSASATVGSTSVTLTGDTYAGYTYTIGSGDVSSGGTTIAITATATALNQSCQITLPSTGNGIASVVLTDLAGTAITSPVVEGTGIKIVLTPDTDFSISTISIANLNEGTDYTVTDNNGVKTITIQHVTGNVVVSATTSQPTELRLNLKWFNEPTAQEKVITEGTRFTLDLIPLFNDKSYKFIAAATQDAGTENEKDIRAAVQVIMGGVDISSQSGVVTFDETNNKVTIDIANPVGIVTINATARLRITRNRFWNQVGAKDSSTQACACESMIPFPQSVAGKVRYLYYGAGYSMPSSNVVLLYKQDLSSNTYWSTQGVYKKIDTLSSGTDYSSYFVYMKPTIGLAAAEGGVIPQEADPNNPVYPYISAQRKAETGESYDDIPIVPVVTREDFNNALFEDPTN